MIKKEEAIKIARRYWKAKRPSESSGMRRWEISVSRGSTQDTPGSDFEIPPQKKFIKDCWIVEMFDVDVKDYSPAYIVWVERKTGEVARSGVYEIHCLYEFSRWFFETTHKREKEHKLNSRLEAKI